MIECEMSMDEFEDITVKVAVEKGVVSAPGFVHKACPGLAVTMYPFGCFTVSHISAGTKMCGHYERAANAILVLSQYALIAASKGVSWADLDKGAVIQLIRDAGQDEVPFEGCTSTSSEGVRAMTVQEWRAGFRVGEFPWEETNPFEAAVKNFSRVGEAV